MKLLLPLMFFLVAYSSKAQLLANEQYTELVNKSLVGHTTGDSILITKAAENRSSLTVHTESLNSIYPLRSASWLRLMATKAPDNKPLIQWEVTEKAVAHYIVERSMHGDPFTEVGRVVSLGDGQYRYEVADPAYTTGRAVYRIAQVTLAGNYNYSHLLYFNENEIHRSYVYPTPASRTLKVVVTPSLVNSQAFLYNTSGQVIQRISINGTTTDISCERLSKGFYILKLQDGTALRIIKD